MRYLLFSDIHCDKDSCNLLVQKSKKADIAIGAGDYAFFRKSLDLTIELLSKIKIPVVLVPGNHETLNELRDACKMLNNFHILHGTSIKIDGITFMGI
ncbi:MAG: metallophosphoesterase family protein, partial [Desulfamplus sp.]|nr:metallophosphoesterase family protein [Desulfamplus sp.]